MKPNDERIADALERIADALEAREGKSARLDRDIRKMVLRAAKAGPNPDVSAIVAEVLTESEPS